MNRNKKNKEVEKRQVKHHTQQFCLVSITLKPIEAYCLGCGQTFQNIDGCPRCGTDRFIDRGTVLLN